MAKKNKPKSAKELLKKWKNNPDRVKSRKYVKHEFQDFGIRLANKLNDPSHKSLYIKLAKEEKRAYLQRAYRFAIDYPNMEGKNKGKLFMFALKKLRSGKPIRDKNFKSDKKESD